MRILLILFAFTTLFLFSCQKEVHFANNGNGGNGGNSGTVLTKIVSKSGTDSSSLLFGFNSSQQLMTLDAINASGGTTSITNERVERNSQGVIQKLIIKNDQYRQAGLDSVETLIGYSSGRYVSKVTIINLGVSLLRDSIALIYDGNGKVVTEETFDDLGSGNYDATRKTDYTYSGNNISSIKIYNYDASSSSYTLQETFTYDEYDDKISPMTIGNEAFVFDSPELYSANNPTKSSVSVSGSTQTYTTTYAYNSANRPGAATSIILPPDTTITATYYYK